MKNLLQSLFTNKKAKDITELYPLIEQINTQYGELSRLSDDELRGKTAGFRQRVDALKEASETRIGELQAQARKALQEGNTPETERLYREVDQAEKAQNEELEELLEELLPAAFAVVKETCRRFAQQEKLVVTAQDHDRAMAAAAKSRKVQHVVLDGEQATWHNTWEVTGNVLTWNMIHYDVQLIGGITLHRGKIAEMATGEGKTLVATLPAYLNALAGKSVHIVTVNDYLARRDMEWNAPIFQFHGLDVAVIDDKEPHSDGRKAAYEADIVYGTNNEFGFDYLRDNMVRQPDELVQRKHHYAIVDEIDSVLIDEARTPLIISGPVPQGDKHEYDQLKTPIEKLVRKQKQVVQEALGKAKTLMQQGKTKEAGDFLFRAQRGMPKYGPLIKYLSEEGVRSAMHKAEGVYLADNKKRMPEVDEHLYFSIEEANKQIELTEMGREFITPKEDPNFFVLPDLGAALAELDNHPDLEKEQIRQQKEELSRDFAEKSERLHSIQQLLKAYTLFEKEIDYIVQDGKVNIVDENTGRVMHGRRWSDGLHQAVEVKENVKVEALTQTYATITLQNFFRMYHKLAGMTGTAETEANEFHEIYGLDVVVIPTNKPIARADEQDKVYRTKREKFNAIVEEITTLSQNGRPVLVGTTNVEVSEQLSRFLNRLKVKHNVLNAKQHSREADIVAEAGQAPLNDAGNRIGNVTIATNMAGRGTDIKLGEGVREAGGLAIIGSERHESRRIDLQLRGRAGRQGDPGSSQFFVSLEDNLMRMFNSERIAKVMNFLKVPEGEVIQHSRISKAIANAQRKVEENNFGTRKHLLEYDDVMNKQREVIYKRRNNALFGERNRLDVDHMLADTAASIAQVYAGSHEAQALQMESFRYLSVDPEIGEMELGEYNAQTLTDHLLEKARNRYAQKRKALVSFLHQELTRIASEQEKRLGSKFETEFLQRYFPLDFSDRVRMVHVPIMVQDLLDTEGNAALRDLEKTVTLSIIDEHWKDHLRQMDELKQSVQTARFEQKDPLVIYKQEAYNLFIQTVDRINRDVISLLSRAELVVEQNPKQQRRNQRVEQDLKKLKAEQTADASQIDQEPQHTPGSIQLEDGSERKLSRRERRELERRDKKNKQKA